jgi:hypothetical protein
MTTQALVGKRVALFAVLVLVSSGGAALAQIWTLVSIENTTNRTINYEYRWSQDEKWQTILLLPGKTLNHSKPFGRVSRKIPRFYIKFDKFGAAKGARRKMTEYHLAEGFANAKNPDLGERHVFKEAATSIDIFHRPKD